MFDPILEFEQKADSAISLVGLQWLKEGADVVHMHGMQAQLDPHTPNIRAICSQQL